MIGKKSRDEDAGEAEDTDYPSDRLQLLFDRKLMLLWVKYRKTFTIYLVITYVYSNLEYSNIVVKKTKTLNIFFWQGIWRIISSYSIPDDNLCDKFLAFLNVLLKFRETSIEKFLLFGREFSDRVYFFNTVRLHVKKEKR